MLGHGRLCLLSTRWECSLVLDWMEAERQPFADLLLSYLSWFRVAHELRPCTWLALWD